MSELRECPFCGGRAEFPDGLGTQYEILCSDCGIPNVSVQICDLMTIEERVDDPFTNFRYKPEFIERAKKEAIKAWNTRAEDSQMIPREGIERLIELTEDLDSVPSQVVDMLKSLLNPKKEKG